MDDEDEIPPRRPSISQLSKTPSWIMLGFMVGAAFVWTMRRPDPPAPRPIVVAPVPEKPRVLEPRQLTTVETVFDEWSKYAVWDDDTTQIAVWNPGMGDFTDLYEVRRINGEFYFRSIPRLTSRILRHGKPPPTDCPIRFTETPAQYEEWRSEGRYERPPEDVRPTIDLPRVQPPALSDPAIKMPPPTPPASPAIDPNVKIDPKR